MHCCHLVFCSIFLLFYLVYILFRMLHNTLAFVALGHYSLFWKQRIYLCCRIEIKQWWLLGEISLLSSWHVLKDLLCSGGAWHWQEYHLCVSIDTQTKHTGVNAWSRASKKNTRDEGRKSQEQNCFQYVSTGCMWQSTFIAAAHTYAKEITNYKASIGASVGRWSFALISALGFFAGYVQEFPTVLTDSREQGDPMNRRWHNTCFREMSGWTELQTQMTHSHTIIFRLWRRLKHELGNTSICDRQISINV